MFDLRGLLAPILASLRLDTKRTAKAVGTWDEAMPFDLTEVGEDFLDSGTTSRTWFPHSNDAGSSKKQQATSKKQVASSRKQVASSM